MILFETLEIVVGKAMKKLQQFLDICSIRWVEKVTELTDFEELFALIEFCLKEMCLNTGHV